MAGGEDKSREMGPWSATLEGVGVKGCRPWPGCLPHCLVQTPHSSLTPSPGYQPERGDAHLEADPSFPGSREPQGAMWAQQSSCAFCHMFNVQLPLCACVCRTIPHSSCVNPNQCQVLLLVC